MKLILKWKNGLKRIVSDKMPSNEDLMNILAQINQWISNCDTKSSILLTLVGIIVGVIFSNGFALKLISLYKKSPALSWELIIYSSTLLCSSILILSGIRHIILSISPNFKITHTNKDSLIFYASIASKTLEEYETEMKSPDYEFDKDIISQIHINSQICTRKFVNYKKGFKELIMGFSIITLLIIIRYTVYVI